MFTSAYSKTAYIVMDYVTHVLAGGVILKGSQRFLGTALGVALGLAALYFTYLCNGLTYANHPQKVNMNVVGLLDEI